MNNGALWYIFPPMGALELVGQGEEDSLTDLLCVEHAPLVHTVALIAAVALP